MIEIAVGDGIVLREPREDDADRLFALIDANRVLLGRWMPWLDYMRHDGDSLTYIRYSQEGNREGRFLNLLIWVDDEPAGVLCYFALEPAQRRSEIGYWLGQRWHGRGIMSRACQALIDYGFGHLNLYRIQIACAVDNLPSRALPERLGFTFEGVLHGREWVGERVLDHAIYALLLPAWRARRPA
ncbi:MAG: GNAT family N-acetyltransferase [Paludibacterium sp.]|uniref:GNAT family N-acetyltransferase n=1 Tax=Paludibacterium sp. TaxID=1917523 RepID=UPI0025DE9532|nr:GNAT family protein [Paludibacterium sp.]MBV8046422.1 GNAT family N-acetyltransferase [Paludibacterium sp.]MBV8648913.1 GNAT family N-acetyltransferase [Paludibacterium sp.]